MSLFLVLKWHYLHPDVHQKHKITPMLTPHLFPVSNPTIFAMIPVKRRNPIILICLPSVSSPLDKTSPVKPRFQTMFFDAHCPCEQRDNSDFGEYYLNCDSILFDFILCHISAIPAPLGHHFRLAESHLVHLLDVVVQVACGTACMLADGTYPWLCSAVEKH